MQPSNDQAIFYLQFVNAAYAMYEADPNNLTPAAQGFPDSSYQILMYLTATDPESGVRVFFGFIAADPANTQTKPGIIAIRGTDNYSEWMTDFDATPTPFAPFPGSYVATGFDEFASGIVWVDPNGQTCDPVATLGEAYPKGFVMTGHSLGGAIATLVAAGWLAAVPQLMMTLVTAASPAVGDAAFANAFNAVAQNLSWRYINYFDVVASAFDAFYTQVSNEIGLYSFDIIATPGCEHSLETYIYLLSPNGTPCTSGCCIIDEDRKQYMRTVFSQRRALPGI